MFKNLKLDKILRWQFYKTKIFKNCVPLLIIYDMKVNEWIIMIHMLGILWNSWRTPVGPQPTLYKPHTLFFVPHKLKYSAITNYALEKITLTLEH